MTESDKEVRRDLLDHIGKIASILSKVSSELDKRAMCHDASKFEEPELTIFNKYTPLLKTTPFGSDEYKEQLKGMGVGLAHHYQENRHHTQHHTAGALDMTLIDLLEMLADWKAASLRSKDGTMEGSIAYCVKEYKIPTDIARLLRNTAHALGLMEEGMPEW